MDLQAFHVAMKGTDVAVCSCMESGLVEEFSRHLMVSLWSVFEVELQ